MQDLKPIRVFLAVADALSFSQAARRLGMTPASVTRIVAALEERLGQQLLVRTTRQVSLTGAGAMIASRYRPVVAAFDRVSAEIDRESRPDHGLLRVNAPLSLGLRVLPGLVDAFRAHHPHIDLDVQLADRLVDIMTEPCDLAIRVSGPPSGSSTIWRKVCEVPRFVVAAPRFFKTHPRPDTPTALDPSAMLSYSSDGRPETWQFEKAATRHAVQASGAITSNNGDFLYDLAVAGRGMCLLPDFLVRAGLASGEVERVLPDWTLPSLWLTLYYPPYDSLPPLVARFTEFFETYIRDLGGMVFD